MIEVVAPQEDLNTETATLIKWYVDDGSKVEKQKNICCIETSKAIFDLESPASGFLFHRYLEGSEIAFNETIAIIAESTEEIKKVKKNINSLKAKKDETKMKATKKAIQLASQYNIDLQVFNKKGIITESDVKSKIQESINLGEAHIITESGVLPKGLKNILILGAGLGAMQVIDILLHDSNTMVVGCLDENRDLYGKKIFGFEVLGELNMMEELWRERKIHAVVISVSTNINFRKKWFEKGKSMGIPFINVIDPSVKINRSVVLGEGNVICSQSHIGVATVIGDNNFISAHNSIDHHNIWGSHNTTGPTCATSSRVKVGDCVKFGTGIFIQPGVGIGNHVLIASGVIITKSIPSYHAVKTKIITEVKPIRSKQ